MSRPSNTPQPSDPTQDPLLAAVPVIEGYKVLGKTILLEVIGHGGMGVVYRGWHMTFHIDVAVKVLKPALAADRDYVRRFRRESQAALKITHQNVVRAYDVEELHGLHYFVMEFVDGESAWQRVGRRGRLSPAAALTVFAGAATGLAEAHAHGLVHRDIKPSNLLIARSGRVKLADLGLVHPAMDADDAAAAGAGGDGSSRLLGTPQYLAPEQWDAAPAQMSADVWALGATLYYLATGRHGLPRMPKAELRNWVREQPFPTLGSVLRSLPELNAIFERCVQRDPAARFATAGELSQALLALGPGDEELLREGAPEVSQAGAGLPPNEVLGRIDAQLRRGAPTSAAPSMSRAKPSVGPVVVTPRRHVAAARQRSGSGGLIVVVVLAVIAIVGSIVYLRSQNHRNDDAAATTRDGSVTGPPSPAEALGGTPSLPSSATEATGAVAQRSASVPTPAPPKAVVKDEVAVVREAATERAESVAAAAVSPAATSPRDTLQAWLAHRADESQMQHLARHRDSLLLEYRQAAAADATAAAVPIEVCLLAFDELMRAFPGVVPGSVPESSVDQLLAIAGAMRRQGKSIEPLLPYLLLLQKNDADDPRVAFCLFEAWAVEALDLQCARDAAADVQHLLSASAATSPLRARLPEVAFEVAELGDDGIPLLARVVRGLGAGRTGGALGPFAIARACVPELEAGYAKAMQGGDVDAVGRHLRALRVVDPADRAAEVLLAVATGRRDAVTFDYAVLTPEEKVAVDARAVHLGLAAIEDQLDVAGALQRLGDATAQFAFFDTGLESQLASKEEESNRINKEIPALRRSVSALEAKAADQTQKSANLTQKNPVASEKARLEALRFTDEAKAVRAEIPSLEQTLQSLKKDVRRLTAEVEALRKLRAAFQLQ